LTLTFSNVSTLYATVIGLSYDKTVAYMLKGSL